MKRITLIILSIPCLFLNAQINEPEVIFKESDIVIEGTLAELVDFDIDGIFQNKALYSLWLDNCVLYYSENERAKLFSFIKISFKEQEYFVFCQLEIDSIKSDSILMLYQNIRNYSSSRYLNNWRMTVDGRLYQVEVFNEGVDYQLKTYFGIQSNLEHCPEAQHLDVFLNTTERIINDKFNSQLKIPYDDFYIDYSSGRFIPRLNKAEFKRLKENPEILIRKTTANKK